MSIAASTAGQGSNTPLVQLPNSHQLPSNVQFPGNSLWYSNSQLPIPTCNVQNLSGGLTTAATGSVIHSSIPLAQAHASGLAAQTFVDPLPIENNQGVEDKDALEDDFLDHVFTTDFVDNMKDDQVLDAFESLLASASRGELHYQNDPSDQMADYYGDFDADDRFDDVIHGNGQTDGDIDMDQTFYYESTSGRPAGQQPVVAGLINHNNQPNAVATQVQGHDPVPAGLHQSTSRLTSNSIPLAQARASGLAAQAFVDPLPIENNRGVEDNDALEDDFLDRVFTTDFVGDMEDDQVLGAFDSLLASASRGELHYQNDPSDQMADNYGDFDADDCFDDVIHDNGQTDGDIDMDQTLYNIDLDQIFQWWIIINQTQPQHNSTVTQT